MGAVIQCGKKQPVHASLFECLIRSHCGARWLKQKRRFSGSITARLPFREARPLRRDCIKGIGLRLEYRERCSETGCHWFFSFFPPPKDLHMYSSQFSSVVQLCLTLCKPMDCSMPGFPVHHQLLELAHTHVHQVGDAIQPFHPLSSLSPPAFNLSQHQGLFQWVSSLHQVAKILEFQLQHQSFQWILRTDFL